MKISQADIKRSVKLFNTIKESGNIFSASWNNDDYLEHSVTCDYVYYSPEQAKDDLFPYITITFKDPEFTNTQTYNTKQIPELIAEYSEWVEREITPYLK